MIETTKWKTREFSYPDNIPTMISEEEKQYLYWLGEGVWSGAGSIVEIGPWLGGSTVCLAKGMRASGNDAHKQLKVFDNFIWREFMSSRADVALAPGESFHRHFLDNMKDLDGIVDSYARALPDEEISADAEASAKRYSENEQVPMFNGKECDGPIEILFIDGAKSWKGIRHLMNTLVHNLVPGTSLLVCQDYKYWGCYWVPLFLAGIKEYVTPVHNVTSATTVTFQVTGQIPAGLVDALPSHVADLSSEAAIANLNRAADDLARDGDCRGAFNLRLCKVSFLSHKGELQSSLEEFMQIQRRWPMMVNASQLERARNYLKDKTGKAIPTPMRLKLGQLLQKLARKLFS